MDPYVALKDYVDARDDAVESRLSSKLESIPSKGTVWGAVATGFGLLAALLAFGGDRFDGGVSVSPIIARLQVQQTERDKDQDAKLKLMDDKLDILIKQTADK